jgi:hypothetical protein
VYDIWDFYTGHFADLAFEIPLFSSALINNLINILHRILYSNQNSVKQLIYTMPGLTREDAKVLQVAVLVLGLPMSDFAHIIHIVYHYKISNFQARLLAHGS